MSQQSQDHRQKHFWKLEKHQCTIWIDKSLPGMPNVEIWADVEEE